MLPFSACPVTTLHYRVATSWLATASNSHRLAKNSRTSFDPKKTPFLERRSMRTSCSTHSKEITGSSRAPSRVKRLSSRHPRTLGCRFRLQSESDAQMWPCTSSKQQLGTAWYRFRGRSPNTDPIQGSERRAMKRLRYPSTLSRVALRLQRHGECRRSTPPSTGMREPLDPTALNRPPAVPTRDLQRPDTRGTLYCKC